MLLDSGRSDQFLLKCSLDREDDLDVDSERHEVN